MGQHVFVQEDGLVLLVLVREYQVMQLEHRIEVVLLDKPQLKMYSFDFEAQAVDPLGFFQVVNHNVDLR